MFGFVFDVWFAWVECLLGSLVLVDLLCWFACFSILGLLLLVFGWLWWGACYYSLRCIGGGSVVWFYCYYACCVLLCLVCSGFVYFVGWRDIMVVAASECWFWLVNYLFCLWLCWFGLLLFIVARCFWMLRFDGLLASLCCYGIVFVIYNSVVCSDFIHICC